MKTEFPLETAKEIAADAFDSDVYTEKAELAEWLEMVCAEVERLSPAHVWAALYCSNIHESSYKTLSLHRNKETAELAIKGHELNEFRRDRELMKKSNLSEKERENFLSKSGQHEDWKIEKVKICD